MSGTKFHTNTEQQANIILYVSIFTFSDSSRELNGSKHYPNSIRP
jgi:hypothetical protein